MASTTDYNNYKRAKDILFDNPGLPWSDREIGYLFMLGLVRGTIVGRRSLIFEPDVLAIAAHRKIAA